MTIVYDVPLRHCKNIETPVRKIVRRYDKPIRPEDVESPERLLYLEQILVHKVKHRCSRNMS